MNSCYFGGGGEGGLGSYKCIPHMLEYRILFPYETSIILRAFIQLLYMKFDSCILHINIRTMILA